MPKPDSRSLALGNIVAVREFFRGDPVPMTRPKGGNGARPRRLPVRVSSVLARVDGGLAAYIEYSAGESKARLTVARAYLWGSPHAATFVPGREAPDLAKEPKCTIPPFWPA